MPITSVPSKMKSINNAIGFEEFLKHLYDFTGKNNIAGSDIVLNVLNSFYFMSPDLTKVFANDNDTSQDQETTKST